MSLPVISATGDAYSTGRIGRAIGAVLAGTVQQVSARPIGKPRLTGEASRG